MKAKTYLETYEHLYRQAQRLTEKIGELETLVTSGSGAIRYDQDSVMHSPGSGLTQAIEHKVQLEMVLDATVKELHQVGSDLAEIFSRFPDRDRRIAELTWFEFEGSVYISHILQINRSTVFRRQHAIINMVQNILDKSST